MPVNNGLWHRPFFELVVPLNVRLPTELLRINAYRLQSGLFTLDRT